jgi:hypothetical protein
LEALERQLSALLATTRDVVATGAEPQQPKDGWGFYDAKAASDSAKRAADKPPQPAKPPPRAPGQRGGFNDPGGWQGPPVPNAPRLPPPPPPKPPQDPRKVIVGYIEAMRACAVHFHNCSRLLLVIADLLEAKINDRRR